MTEIRARSLSIRGGEKTSPINRFEAPGVIYRVVRKFMRLSADSVSVAGLCPTFISPY